MKFGLLQVLLLVCYHALGIVGEMSFLKAFYADSNCLSAPSFTPLNNSTTNFNGAYVLDFCYFFSRNGATGTLKSVQFVHNSVLNAVSQQQFTDPACAGAPVDTFTLDLGTQACNPDSTDPTVFRKLTVTDVPSTSLLGAAIWLYSVLNGADETTCFPEVALMDAIAPIAGDGFHLVEENCLRIEPLGSFVLSAETLFFHDSFDCTGSRVEQVLDVCVPIPAVNATFTAGDLRLRSSTTQPTGAPSTANDLGCVHVVALPLLLLFQQFI